MYKKTAKKFIEKMIDIFTAFFDKVIIKHFLIKKVATPYYFLFISLFLI